MEEQDDLKAFLFAAIGLERLARSLETWSSGQLLNSLRLASGDTAPAKDLLLPDNQRGENPSRSVKHAFALLVSVVTPSSAIELVSRAKPIIDKRNDIAHGKADRIDSEMRQGAQAMLKDLIQQLLAYDST